MSVRSHDHAVTVGIVMPLALQRGGCETMLLNLLRANRSGIDQTYKVCFLEDGPMVKEVKEMGYSVTTIRAGRLRQFHNYFKTLVQLVMWMRRERIDQVISWMEKAHLYASPASVIARVPAAWWLHSVDPDNKLMRIISALPANHLFSDSQAALDLRNPKWRKHPSSVCHCAVDLTRFSSTQLPCATDVRKELGLPDRPTVGIVARLQRWKGIDVFIKAAVRLTRGKAPGPTPVFIIIGGEHAFELGVKEELEALIDLLEVRDHVTLAGYQQDVPRWMQACDVIVHCSTGVEPFGTIIVEAMALGKCVVAADAGGPREIITDGVNGRLTPAGDDAALAEAISELLADTPAMQAMRYKARQRAAHFSADRLARCVRGTVNQLIATTHDVESESGTEL